MTVYYTNEKARYGGITGSIIPYTVKMPAVNDGKTGDWKEYLPAGYLRCDGSILKAQVYPVLAQVLGTGNDSKFRKDGTDLGFDEFQLPDLGSKYISGGNASGTYLNTTITNSNAGSQTGSYRVGAEINVTSLVGDTETVTYTGNFTVVPKNLEFIGNPSFGTVQSDGKTLTAFLSEQEFQAHGHDAEVGIFSYLGRWLDSFAVNTTTGTSQGGNDGMNEGSNNLITVSAPTDSNAVVGHGHFINFPNTTTVKDNNNLSFSFAETQIDTLGLESTVTVTTEKLYKLDEATPPYILVEYLIKI